MPLPDFEPRSDWVATPVHELPAWPERGRVAVDIETKDVDLLAMGPGVRRDGYIVGVSFAIEDGPAHYLPVAHRGGGNLAPEAVFDYLRSQGQRFKGDIVGAGLGYDLDYLAEQGINFDPRFFRDIQVAEPIIDELHWNYNLDAVAERHGMPGKDERLLETAAEAYGVNKKAGLWQLPAKFVGAYAEQDARLPLGLIRRQERIIEDQDLQGIYDLESRVLPILVAMRRRGVRIDFDQVERVERWSLAEEEKLLAEIKRLTGVDIGMGNLAKASVVAPALEAIGAKLPLTEKTQQPSVTSEVLGKIDHPVAKIILEARAANKVRTTFCKSIRRHAVGDRVHCTFNQLRSSADGDDPFGTVSGRLSSTNPNLQQQPNRHPVIGPMWRAVYLPDEGGEWLCADYSQQEPRWLIHYASRTKCHGADKAFRQYIDDPSTDTHNMTTQLVYGDEFVLEHYVGSDSSSKEYKKAKHLRGIAKQIFLGLCYGMGAGKLCRNLGLPTKWVMSRRLNRMIEVAGPKGDALFKKFHRGVPYIKKLAEMCTERANKMGYVITAGGRRCRFEKGAKGHERTHKALNAVLQGSGADQTKIAMVAAEEAGHPLQLQVHDELNETIGDHAQAYDLAEIMLAALPCDVPHKVDVEVGPNWGDVHGI